MLATSNRAAVCGFSSNLSLATRRRPNMLVANSSMTDAMARHGPHRGAHMSTTTGSGDCSTLAANVASVTVSGLCSSFSGVLQRPHTGLTPSSRFSCGTRLSALQEEQRNINSSDISASAILSTSMHH